MCTGVSMKYGIHSRFYHDSHCKGASDNQISCISLCTNAQCSLVQVDSNANNIQCGRECSTCNWNAAYSYHCGIVILKRMKIWLICRWSPSLRIVIVINCRIFVASTAIALQICWCIKQRDDGRSCRFVLHLLHFFFHSIRFICDENGKKISIWKASKPRAAATTAQCAVWSVCLFLQ